MKKAIKAFVPFLCCLIFLFPTTYAETTEDPLNETIIYIEERQPDTLKEVIKTISLVAFILAIVIALYKSPPKPKEEKKELSESEAAALKAKLSIANHINKLRGGDKNEKDS